MSKFTDYIDGFADKTSTLAKDELKDLIISAKKDESEFVRMQAENVEPHCCRNLIKHTQCTFSLSWADKSLWPPTNICNNGVNAGLSCLQQASLPR